MKGIKEEALQFNARYWKQNARMSIRDVYDALVEIITNSDDRYSLLGSKLGRIEIEIERRRKGTPSIIRVRDFADGMTSLDMEKKLLKVGDRVSGLADGKDVRGTHSRGAKDVAILGGVTFESIASDGEYHKCEITPGAKFRLYPRSEDKLANHREQLGIRRGTGTLVTLLVDQELSQVPQHDTLRQNVSQLVALSDILSSPEREVFLIDGNQGRQNRLCAPAVDASERISETFSVPGYDQAEAKLVIRRSKEPFDIAQPKLRLGGILIKSRKAIHEATLFDPHLETDPHARWFCGFLRCKYIDDLSNDWDEKEEKGIPHTRENPSPIVNPDRRDGLVREHPFVKALFQEALKRLRPLVEQERQQSENKQSRIVSNDTRKRLRALEAAATKFISDNYEHQEDTRESDGVGEDSVFAKKGYSINPPFTQLVVGQSCKYWLSISQTAFPELAVGDSVEISCLTNEVSSSQRFHSLETHPKRENVLRCVWMVKGEKATGATGLKVRVGSIVAESTIEVLANEREKYSHIHDLCFGKKNYSLIAGGKRNITLLAPSPALVTKATQVTVSTSDSSYRISGDQVLLPQSDLGIAICRLRVSCAKAGSTGRLEATLLNRHCSANIVCIEPTSSTITIDLVDADYKNQRYYWKENVLEIAARHPSLRRYLGDAPLFRGQEETHFRVLLAEIVADAVCNRLISRNEKLRPEDFSALDWDAYYAEYSKYMTQFLPIAHDTQVKL